MKYRFEKMTEVPARDIATWRYPGEYSFYNPDEAYLEEVVAWMLEPRNDYYAIYDQATLVGFCCFGEDAQVEGGDYSLPDTLDIGLGMRPELTGQGKGASFLAGILAFAQHHYQPSHFRATIATFNQRAQRIFAKAGFRPVQRFMSHIDRPIEFIVMVRDASAQVDSTS